MPRVSIIVPVYNVEDYVDRCVASLTGQTFSDIEIILINDGSSDRSGDKCVEWANRDKRIIYINKHNEGAGPARNIGIEKATGEFVAFCDSDDWYDLKYIEVMLSKQQETDADIVVCGRYNYDGLLDEATSVFIPTIDDIGYQNKYLRIPPSLWLKLFRKSLFIDNDIKMPSCVGQDMAINHFIITKAQKIVIIEKPLYYYWVNRSDSVMGNPFRHTSETVAFAKYSWNLFIRDNIFEENKEDLFKVATGLVNFWYPQIKDDVEYSEKWFYGMIDAMREYFGDMVKICSLKVLIVGSYSLFNGFPRTLPKQAIDKMSKDEYCFSSLISYMSDKPAVPPVLDNSFRQTAIDNDFKKTLIKDIKSKDIDYIIIDFLDERFDIVENDGGYYTKSEVFMEADVPDTYHTLERGDSKTTALWEEKCLEFIALLKERFTAQNVILVKNYLSSNIKIANELETHDNIDEILRLNAVISSCYDFFEANFPGIQVVEIPTGAMFYTDSNFRHGCVPWHYNQRYYNEVRKQISDRLFEELLADEDDYFVRTATTVEFFTQKWDILIKCGFFEAHKNDLLDMAAEHVLSWYPRIKSNVIYSEKWLADCLAAIKKYFGDVPDLCAPSICAIGSQSLYKGLPFSNLPDHFKGREIIRWYCFSGLISYTSNRTVTPPYVNDFFRQTSIDRDFQKTLMFDISNRRFDYIILDFLDERFDIAKISDGYYTLSDIFADACLAFEYSAHEREATETISLWEEKCLEFISLLKQQYSAHNIILVKNRLLEGFRAEGLTVVFDDIDKIKRINAIIDKCYSFFEAHFPGVKSIEVNNSDLLFTQKDMGHDCAPWYYSQEYYDELKAHILDCLSF